MYGQYSQQSTSVSAPKSSMTPVTLPVNRIQLFGSNQPAVIFNPVAARSQPRREVVSIPQTPSRMDTHIPTYNGRDPQNFISSQPRREIVSIPQAPSRMDTHFPTYNGRNAQNLILSQPRREIVTYETPYRMNSHFPAHNGRDSQKLISQYFKESKSIDKEPNQSARGTKRNLRDLQMKYDNIYSQPIQVPHVIEVPRFLNERKSPQRATKAQQTTSGEIDFLPKRNRLSKPHTPPKNAMDKKLKNVERDGKIEPKSIHLVGHVENVLLWNEHLKHMDVHVMYNVLGTFVSVMNGTHSWEKFVFIRGNNGTILECSFFEIDRPLAKFIKGQHVACFGHVTGVQRLRLYSIDLLNETDRTDAQRAIFLSQRATYELADRKSTF